jgi:hypothetical protein
MECVPRGTIPSSGLSRVIVCQALFLRNLARNIRHRPRNAVMESSLHHFFDDRTDAAALDALMRGR